MAVLALDVSDVPGDLRHLVEDRVEAEGSSSDRPIDGPPEIVDGRQRLKFASKGIQHRDHGLHKESTCQLHDLKMTRHR